MQNDHKFISLNDKSLMSSSSQDPKPAGTGKLSQCFQVTFSEREQPVDVVFGSNEPIFRFSNPTKCSEISS